MMATQPITSAKACLAHPGRSPIIPFGPVLGSKWEAVPFYHCTYQNFQTGGFAAVADMEAAVEAAFAAIGTVHRLMSEATTSVHRWTFQVLETALDIQRRSNGLFDIRIAPALQQFGLLPYQAILPMMRL